MHSAGGDIGFSHLFLPAMHHATPSPDDHDHAHHAHESHAHHDGCATCGCHAHDHAQDAVRRIYVYSPSGAVQDKAAFRRGIRRLTALGHQVEVDEAALARHTRFAGDDATRLQAVARATASGADVALISRGGYGLSRLLPHLDYAAIAQAIDGGLQYVGFSDFTAFQLAVLRQTGRITWAGAALGVDLGTSEEPDEITLACLEDLLYRQGEGTGWRLGKAAKGAPVQPDLLIEDARLWGGNLAVLVSLLGTPYWPDVEGGVLFLEDVAEHPYRIERMLIQLEMAGVLQKQRAIVLGQFTDYQRVPQDRGFKLDTVVQGLRERLGVPVLTNLPFGHVPTKVSLPVGATVSLQTQGRDALLVWGHL
jgi:muramoyltetrapeptide carboxypeptidase